MMLVLANRGVDVLRLDAVRVPVEADGHRLPEPARGPRHLQALPGAEPDRRARRCCSRRRRSSRPDDARAAISGGHATTGEVRPRLPQPADGAALVGAGGRTPGWRPPRSAALPPTPAATAWVTYLRCHDDIGWAVTDEDAAAVGLGGFDHRRFLADFYAGAFPGSFARGAVFQENPRHRRRADQRHGRDAWPASTRRWPRRRRRRLDAALAPDPAGSRGGLLLRRRAAALDGRRDRRCATTDGWAADPAHADDSRWLHRPAMDWAAAPPPLRPGDRGAGVVHGDAAAGRGPPPRPQLHARHPGRGRRPPAAAAAQRSCAAARSVTLLASTTSPSSPSRSAPWPCTSSATTSRCDHITGQPAQVDHGPGRARPVPGRLAGRPLRAAAAGPAPGIRAACVAGALRGAYARGLDARLCRRAPIVAVWNRAGACPLARGRALVLDVAAGRRGGPSSRSPGRWPSQRIGASPTWRAA